MYSAPYTGGAYFGRALSANLRDAVIGPDTEGLGTLLRPAHVYGLALRAIDRIRTKYTLSDEITFARYLVGLAFQESCVKKNAVAWECFDTEAKNSSSSATGLTQVLKGTQPAIEKIMSWPTRPLDDRKDPQYAMDLAAAYMAYHYKRSTPSTWYKALVSYHDGHYSAKGAGNKYAKLVEGHIKMFPWDLISTEAQLLYGPSIAYTEFRFRQEFR